MMIKTCSICGRPFSPVDIVLSEHDAGFQCRHCWNRAQATGDASRPAAKKPRVLPARTRAKSHGR